MKKWYQIPPKIVRLGLSRGAFLTVDWDLFRGNRPAFNELRKVAIELLNKLQSPE